MIGVIDYGAGNRQSVVNALDHIGAPHDVCSAPENVRDVERLTLPGVGRFGAAAIRLERTGLRASILEFAASSRPMPGTCLGITSRAADAVYVPVIASGGAGAAEHSEELFRVTRAAAGRATSVFHEGAVTSNDNKRGLRVKGIGVRLSRRWRRAPNTGGPRPRMRPQRGSSISARR